MDATRFDGITRLLVDGGTRRGVLGFLATLPLAGTLALILEEDASEARKKRKKKHKKKREKKCGKTGGKPVKGKCCKAAVPVDGACRRCDVCASGCALAAVQTAIDAAGPGDTIAICPGAYREDLTISQDARLVGAGDGGGSGGTTVQGTGASSVVVVSGGVVALERLRLTGGGGNPAQLHEGGGIYNEGATALTRCTVTGNSASYGGGIFHAAGAMTLTTCTVSGNSVDSDGGGIYVLDVDATMELVGCTVSENRAHNDSGGGIYNQGTLDLTTSEVKGNAADYGGGVYNYYGAMTVDAASRISGNTAAKNGGGVYIDGAVTLASSANVTDNTPNNCAGAAVEHCIG